MSNLKGNTTSIGYRALPALATAMVCLLVGLMPSIVAAQQDAVLVGPVESVIGGSEAPAGAFPSVVALVKQGRFSPAGRQFCGGTVVETTWVLTAAHCLFDADTNLQLEASTFRVIGGIENLRFDTDFKETMVMNIYVHPSYSHDTSAQNDIALLELATPLAEPVGTLYLDDRQQLDGMQADIVGWGATYYVSPALADYPDHLQTATVPIVPLSVCNAPQSYNNALIDSQMCAGLPEGGIDTCAGDSGGPLYVNINGVKQQAGIVSFGRGCAEPDLYGIYTSIPSFTTWLSQYITIDKGQPRSPGAKPSDPDGDGSTDGIVDGSEPDNSNGASTDPLLNIGSGGGGVPAVHLLVALFLLLGFRRAAAEARRSSAEACLPSA